MGSTAAVTNDIAYLNQELQYYPFGGMRVSEQYGGLNQSNQYIGQDYDSESELSYLQARYYDGGAGRFMSQDPVHLAIGDTKKFAELIPMRVHEYLKNPQTLNSYSYAGNNPIRFSDPKGLWYVEIALGGDYFVFNASIGLRFDGTGVDGFVSGGPSLGVSAPIQASFSSGNLSHEQQVTVSRNAEFMAGSGMGISEEGIYDYQRPFSTGKNAKTSYSINAGLGGGVSQKYTLSVPLMSYRNGSSGSTRDSRTPSVKSYNSSYNALKEAKSAMAKGDLKSAKKHLERAKESLKK